MVVALVMLLAAFVQELLHALPNLLTSDPEHVILTVLSLIDLSLAGTRGVQRLSAPGVLSEFREPAGGGSDRRSSRSRRRWRS